MFSAHIFRTKIRRVVRKAVELHDTSGSMWRACFFVLRFLTQRFRFFLQHRKDFNAAKDIQLDIRQAMIEQPEGTPFIAVKVTGGLGDYIVIARYLRDLQAEAGPFTFDVFCNYQFLAEWIFSKTSGFRTCYSEFIFDRLLNMYALGLRVNQHITVHQETADWRAFKKNWKLIQAVHNIIRFRPKIEMFIDNHPFMDGFMAQKAVYMNFTRANFLHGMSGIRYGGDRFDVRTDSNALADFGLIAGTYITIHNGFDPGFVVTAKQATKCYPHYGEVVKILKQRFPKTYIVQLGTSTSISIPGVDLDLIGKTSLPEVADIIKHARLHIDNESGLVHLATALGTQCCVVFGPTSFEYFSYDCNVNIRPIFCGGCWWINDTWMDQCPRGFVQARCMSEQSPLAVADAVLSVMNESNLTSAVHPFPTQVSDERKLLGRRD